MDKRNNLWDIVRGIARLSVAFFHYTTKYNELYGHADKWSIIFPWGEIGVCFSLCSPDISFCLQSVRS